MMGSARRHRPDHHQRDADPEIQSFAVGLEKYAGKLPAILFALALLDASIIGAAAVSLATAYAIGDVLRFSRGVGHARLILERFGKFWGAFSVIDLFVLNALTIVTEFIGVSLVLNYLGFSQFWGVLASAAIVMIAVSTGVSGASSALRSSWSSRACCWSR